MTRVVKFSLFGRVYTGLPCIRVIINTNILTFRAYSSVACDFLVLHCGAVCGADLSPVGHACLQTVDSVHAHSCNQLGLALHTLKANQHNCWLSAFLLHSNDCAVSTGWFVIGYCCDSAVNQCFKLQTLSQPLFPGVQHIHVYSEYTYCVVFLE